MKKITSMEYNSLVWFLIRAGYIGITISTIISISKRDSWISVLIALVLGFIPLAIFSYLRNYDENKNICELNEYLFGKFGKVLNIILAVGVAVVAQLAFHDIVHFINTQFLYRTSPVLIAAVFIVPIIYGVLKGINAISRTSLLLFYPVVIAVIFITASVFSGVELNNLKPIFTSTPSIFHGSLIVIAYNILPLFFLLIIPKSSLTNYSKKKSAIFYIIAILTLADAAFLTVGTFGIELSMLYEYPEFHLLKKVEIGNFVDRVESILSIEWLIALFILIMVGLYYVCKTCAHTFKFKEKTNKVFIVFACLMLVFINPFILVTNGSMNELFKIPMLYFMFFFFFIIPLIIWIACHLKHPHNK